jgi:lysosomal Pro-X carboxypeptidase
VQSLTLEQPLDHFKSTQDSHVNATGETLKSTFQQRFYVVDEYYKPGKPIYFLVGPESAMTAAWLYGFVGTEYASRDGGLVVGVEHRYYGESSPTLTYAPRDMKYLMMNQALADYAAVMRYIKQTVAGAALSPVITFGGSYGGLLSALIRTKYPHLITGSVASAAPLMLGIPNSRGIGWNQAVENIYRSAAANVNTAFGGTDDNGDAPTCAPIVSRFMLSVIQAGGASTNHLQSRLRLCGAVSQARVPSLQRWITNALSAVAQFSYATVHMLPRANPLPYFCHQLALAGAASHTDDDETVDDVMQRLLSLYYLKDEESTKCLPFPSSKPSSTLLSSSLSPAMNVTDATMPPPLPMPAVASASKGGPLGLQTAPWQWTTCVEFNNDHSGGDDMLHFDTTAAQQRQARSAYCKRRWQGVAPPFGHVYDVTPVYNASNIIFSNFGFDPVNWFSLNATVAGRLTRLFAADGAHGEDMSIQPVLAQKQSIADMRRREVEIIAKWIETDARAKVESVQSLLAPT